jgi:hypothetical protein
MTTMAESGVFKIALPIEVQKSGVSPGGNAAAMYLHPSKGPAEQCSEGPQLMKRL